MTFYEFLKQYETNKQVSNLLSYIDKEVTAELNDSNVMLTCRFCTNEDISACFSDMRLLYSHESFEKHLAKVEKMECDKKEFANNFLFVDGLAIQKHLNAVIKNYTEQWAKEDYECKLIKIKYNESSDLNV